MSEDHPSAPMNDREFAVWEHGRIQGHNEARRVIERMRAENAGLREFVRRVSSANQRITGEQAADEIEQLRAENATIRKQAALIAAHNAELREVLVPESPANDA